MEDMVFTNESFGLDVLALSSMGQVKAHHYLGFTNRDGVYKKVMVPTTTINNKSALKTLLSDYGYPGVTDDDLFDREYKKVKSARPEERIIISNTAGYINTCYLYGSGEVIGSHDDYGPVLNPDLKITKPKISNSGDIESWKKMVAKYCPHSNNLTLAVCASLSSAFIPFTDIETGGFHFHGMSSIGKSTLLKLAASCFGNSSFIIPWSLTLASLEEIAAGRNHSTLILDELKLLDQDPRSAAKKAQNAIYQLAEGKGKSRSIYFQDEDRNWLLVVLSAGEMSLSAHASAGGNDQLAGERVRLIDIPADAGRDLGIFQSLPEGMDSSLGCVEEIQALCEAHHGIIGRDLISLITDRLKTKPEVLRRKLSDCIDDFLDENLPESANGQLPRICKRFGLAYASGLYAIKLGLLPLTRKQVMDAISACYHIAISEMPVGLEQRVQDLRKSIIKLTENRLKLQSDDELKMSSGCIKRNIKGQEVIGILSSKIENLAPDHDAMQGALRKLNSEGFIYKNSEGKNTWQLKYRGLDGTIKRRRFYCLISDKLAS